MNADKQRVLKERSIRTHRLLFHNAVHAAVRSATRDAARSYIARGLQEVRLMISIIVQL